MKPGGAAKLAGVIGWPVAHSLSPRLHSYWLEQLNIDGIFVPLPVRREDFAVVIRALQLSGFKGVSVTVPHKEAAYAIAHTRDAASDAAGATNLLLFHADGTIEARNTDASGLAASLVDGLGTEFLKGRSAVLIGAGGAARAAVLALNSLGAADIAIVNRHRPRADALVVSLAPRVTAQLSARDWDAWPAAAGSAAIAVNTSSGGMKGQDALRVDLAVLSPGAAVCDLVYNPLKTDFLTRAVDAGHKAVDGLGMLMHQAVPAFEAFFGAKPAVSTELRRALEEALR